MKPYKKLLHKMILIKRYENLDNPEVQTWKSWVDEKFSCSCGFSKDMGMRYLGEIGYGGLQEEHKKWAKEYEIKHSKNEFNLQKNT